MSLEENGGGGGGSPLDLNNLPEDFTRAGKQPSEDTSSSGTWQRKKKRGGRNGKDESGKVYECRFCSLKFCKSQALGGHMNRHRQERETESLNKARQLVFGTENLAPRGPFPPHHLGGGYHHYRQVPVMYPARMFAAPAGGSPATPPPPSHDQPLLYTSAHLPSPPPEPYPPQYPPHSHHDYFLAESSNYTCVGAPVVPPHGSSRGFMLNSLGSATAGHHLHHRIDSTSSTSPINRFQYSSGF